MSTSLNQSSDDEESSGSESSDPGSLSAYVLVKWSFFRDNTIVGSGENISLDGDGGLDDLITYLVDDLRKTDIVIYSGVHGTPSGMLQIDDPDFVQDDMNALAQDADGLRIVIKPVDFDVAQHRIPDGLRSDLDDPNTCVVLGWCNSRYYLSFMQYL